jgi:hypothetical protein
MTSGSSTTNATRKTGNVFWSRGKLYARVSTKAKRLCLALPNMTEDEGRTRAAVLASFAIALDASDHGALADRILEDAATADAAKLD